MVKRLAKSIRQYKKESILAPVFVALEVVMEVLIPFLMADLIDHGIDAGDMNYIIRTGLILIGLVVLAIFFGAMSGRFAAKASAGFARNLRKDLYYKVQTYSFSNIDYFSSASIVTRLTSDVTNIQNAYQMVIRIAVRSPVMLIFAMIMAFGINSQVSLIFVAALPILAVAVYLIMGKTHPIFKRVFKTYDKLNNVVQENLRGIRVVKSYVREEHEAKKFGAVSGEIYNDFSKAERLMALSMPIMQFVIYACMLLISWFGARLIVGGSMSTGQLMSMITYTMQILMSLMMLAMVFVMITISRASGERIVEVLEQEPELGNKENPIQTVNDGSISFQNVSFSYKKGQDKPCLTGINLDIASGQTVGIIGATGASKSSLVQLIPRLYDVTEGAVKVGGIDVRDYEIKALRSAVSMVLQKNVLFSGTIRENLRWGDKNASDEELVAVCKLAQADGFIQEFPEGYDTYIEQGGTNVSGGQKQRLCIARALLKAPQILILDDSTSAVDTKTDAMIRKALREEYPGTTKIIIAQRIASVEDADQIIVMDQGQIHAMGTHDQLLQSSHIYQEVYYSQQKGGLGDVS